MRTGEPRAGPAGWGGHSEERPRCGTSLFQMIPAARRRPLTNSVGRDPRRPIPALRVVVLHMPGAGVHGAAEQQGTGCGQLGDTRPAPGLGELAARDTGLGKEGASVRWCF